MVSLRNRWHPDLRPVWRSRNGGRQTEDAGDDAALSSMRSFWRGNEMSKRKAATYRQAARLIDSERYCHACTAIERTGADGWADLIDEFARWFQPPSLPFIWWGACKHENRVLGAKHKEQRVLGLLFMAAIEESE